MDEAHPILSEQSDESSFLDLLECARAGDQKARDELVLHYRDYLLLLANVELEPSLKPKLGASDVVQQSMMAIHQNLDQFRGTSLAEFKGWIRTILRNNLTNARRHFGQAKQRQASREVRLQDSQLFQVALEDQNKTPQSEALLRELAVEMERCLSELSESHARVIRFRNWEEKTFPEIGDEIGCSADAARKLWFRAFNHLKQIVLTSRPEFASHLTQISGEQPPL